MKKQKKLVVETSGEYKTPVIPKFISKPVKTGRYRFSEIQRKPRKIKKCHLCRVSYLTSEMANCSLPNCPNSYCPDCIKETFDQVNKYLYNLIIQNFDIKKYNPDLWICYGCGKTCKCERCLKAPAVEDLPILRRPSLKLSDLLRQPTGEVKRKRRKIPKKPKAQPPIQQIAPQKDIILGKHKAEAELGDKVEKKSKSSELIENLPNKADLKIIEEVNIDFACFTLYEAQNEEELHKLLKK